MSSVQTLFACRSAAIQMISLLVQRPGNNSKVRPIHLLNWGFLMNNENNETKPDSAIITYKFIVNVISGFLKGKEYQGYFSYNSSQLSNTGEETIEVVDARLPDY